MQTNVGILTFISMINTTSERIKAKYFFICQYFNFYEPWNSMLSWVENEKKFYNLKVWIYPLLKHVDSDHLASEEAIWSGSTLFSMQIKWMWHDDLYQRVWF